MSTEDMVIQARELSRLLHLDQMQANGHSHYDTLHELAEECYFDEMKAAAYLMDAPSMRPDRISVEDIQNSFGNEIGDAVDAMTRRPSENEAEHYARLKQNPLALGIEMKALRRRMAWLEERDETEEKLSACKTLLDFLMS